MRKCDRCDKELGDYGYMSQVNFPLVYVSYCVGLPIHSENADLCSKCQHDIYNYIFKHKESEVNNDKT